MSMPRPLARPLVRRPSRGVTLVELVVVIGILAIIVTMAVPPLGDRFVEARAASRAIALQSSVQAALLAAIKHGEPATLRATGDDFARGWTIFRDADGNGRQDRGDILVDTAPAPSDADTVVIARRVALTFDARGRLVAPEPFVATICARGGDSVAAQRVTVSPTGRIDRHAVAAGPC